MHDDEVLTPERVQEAVEQLVQPAEFRERRKEIGLGIVRHDAALRAKFVEAEHNRNLAAAAFEESGFCSVCKPMSDEGKHFRHDGSQCSFHLGECSDVPHKHQFCPCGKDYKAERDDALAREKALREALVKAKEDMIWMFGAWDGSTKDEAVAVPHAHANIAAIDKALATAPEGKDS